MKNNLFEAFHNGREYRAYDLFAPRKACVNGESGWLFSLWAPRAEGVSLVGDFNGWNPSSHKMQGSGDGVWSVFCREAKVWDCYKFEIKSKSIKNGKTDVYFFHLSSSLSLTQLLIRLRAPTEFYLLPMEPWKWH